MNIFLEALFEKNTVDGICAVLFLDKNYDLGVQGNDQYICMRLYDTPIGNACWFCIKTNMLPKSGRIILKVPEKRVSGVIGKQGMNVKKIGKVLGGKHLTIQKG